MNIFIYLLLVYRILTVYVEINFSDRDITLPGSDSREPSCGTFVYSIILSTDVIWFSNSVICLIPNCKIPTSPIDWVIASPTLPIYTSDI